MHPLTGKQPLLQSVVSALRGFAHLSRARNFLLLCLGALCAQLLLGLVEAPLLGHVLVALCSLITISLEMINTAIEEFADVLVREHHPGVAKTKEIAAGAVLLMTITTALAVLFFISPSLSL